MPSIAITGGIACGKSKAIEILRKDSSINFFSSDDEVSRLLETDSYVIQEIVSAFGPHVYDTEKKINRNYLRSCLTQDPKSKEILEAILHPRLRKSWLPQAKAAYQEPKITFFAEIPLLYEKNLASHFNKVLVIAASRATQIQRLINFRNLSYHSAVALLDLQLPLLEKIHRADFVIWNDGNEFSFYEQLKLAMTAIHH